MLGNMQNCNINLDWKEEEKKEWNHEIKQQQRGKKTCVLYTFDTWTWAGWGSHRKNNNEVK